MKTLKYLIIGIAFISMSSLQAQVSVNVNIGTPPAWGPSGYAEARYYYLPDLEMYYDVNASYYIYLNRGKWVRTRTLPRMYRNYDFYNGYKVVLTDYRGSRPYDNYRTHKVKYGKGYKGKPQHSIGQRPGRGNDKDYGNYNNGHGNNGNGNNGNGNNGNGHGNNGNGKGHGNGKH